jgi:FlaA1/EpsC-like NDP-sugar epimerase
VVKPVLLITGGSGFLGRRLALALKDRYEVVLGARNNKQNSLAKDMTGCTTVPLDVTSIESVRDAFRRYEPVVVVHAAATKFVDLAERQPLECLDVNVVGSQNVARVAIDSPAETVLGISTDKAAPPVRNTYGLSKALMERLFCSLDGTAGTRFLCVRYGNVAWSTGSVLPVWKRMHEEAGIIRTTGPDMRRFFFSVDEAAALVETALSRADELSGRVLCREMKAAQIQDVLDTWIEMRGGSWERMKGRPGERSDEFLIGDLELPFTRELEIAGLRHFVISFNERVPVPLASGLSTANAERLTHEEIKGLIEGEPEAL